MIGFRLAGLETVNLDLPSSPGEFFMVFNDLHFFEVFILASLFCIEVTEFNQLFLVDYRAIWNKRIRTQVLPSFTEFTKFLPAFLESLSLTYNTLKYSLKYFRIYYFF